jgi:hypothetical protein
VKFLVELTLQGQLRPQHIASALNVEDIFTKPLGFDAHEKFLTGLGLHVRLG